MFRYVFALLLAVTVSAPAAAQDAKRGLTPVKGDTYRWQNNFHYSLVVKTEALSWSIRSMKARPPR